MTSEEVSPARRLAAALLAALVLGASGSGAQEAPKFSVTAAMARGPIDAPVTIVEFSDYQ